MNYLLIIPLFFNPAIQIGPSTRHVVPFKYIYFKMSWYDISSRLMETAFTAVETWQRDSKERKLDEGGFRFTSSDHVWMRFVGLLHFFVDKVASE